MTWMRTKILKLLRKTCLLMKKSVRNAPISTQAKAVELNGLLSETSFRKADFFMPHPVQKKMIYACPFQVILELLFPRRAWKKARDISGSQGFDLNTYIQFGFCKHLIFSSHFVCQ